MTRMRLVILIVALLALVAAVLSTMQASGGNNVLLLFLPWLAWPYLLTLMLWWWARSFLAQVCLLIALLCCGGFQAYVYIDAFVWHVDAQSAIGWMIAPLYCLVTIPLFIPAFLLYKRKTPPASTTKHHE